MPLTGSLLKRIQEAILEAFTYADLAQLLRYDLEQNLDTLVTQQANLRRQVAELIEMAETSGNLLPLLQCLAGRQSVSQAELADAHAAVLAAYGSSPPQRDPTWGSTGAAPRVEQAHFRVPFLRNRSFVGREHDLTNLHAVLLDSSGAGHRPVALIGMGGVGKTQLAVEYCYRYQDSYRGGVFWINAAAGWRGEFADLGAYFQPKLADDVEVHRVRAANTYLRAHPDSLLVLDNAEDPAQLWSTVTADLLPAALPCHLLITTRRRSAADLRLVEVGVLQPDQALRLLLRHPARQPILAPDHPEHAEAQAICSLLGRLPLALEIAGAHLGKRPQGALAAYGEELRKRGALPVVDDQRGGVREEELGTRHAAAVAATLAEQWETIESDTARLLLRVAGQLPQAEAIPIARLGLLAGIPDEDDGFFGSPLTLASEELAGLSLVEQLRQDQARLHPLVHEFAGRQTAGEETPAFRRECALRLSSACWDVAAIERQCARRGAAEVERDLWAVLHLLGSQQPDAGLSRQVRQLLRMVQHESHTLRTWQPSEQPAFFLQQWHKRAMIEQQPEVAAAAAAALRRRRQPFLEILWLTARAELQLERTLSGHSGYVNAVALTDDGRWAVSASGDNTLKVWDLESGEELRTLDGHSRWVNAVCVTADRRAVSASGDNTLKVWNLQNGEELHTLRGHGHWVNAVAVTADGRRAVSASRDSTLMVWDLQSGRKLHTLGGHAGGVNAVAVTADGRRAVSASYDSTLMVWDLQRGEALHTLGGHTGPVVAVAATEDGWRAVSASEDGTLKVWDLQRGEELHTLGGHGASATAVALTADGRRAVSASEDGTLKVWDLQRGEELHTLSGHAGGVRSVVVTADGLRALSASRDKTLKIWDLQNGSELRTLDGHRGGVKAIAVTADGWRAVSGSRDNTLKVWDIASAEERHVRSGHAARVNAVAVTADGQRAVSAADDGTLNVWDMQRGEALHRLSGHSGGVSAVAVTGDGRRAVSASDDSTLKVWNLQSGELLYTLSGHANAVKAVALAADGRWAVSASLDGTLRQWDTERGEEVRKLGGHSHWVMAVAITAGGWQAISGSWDSTVRVWDLQNGKALHTLSGHAKTVAAVAVTGDGRRVISASWDGTLKVWDLQSGELLNTLSGHAGAVTAVAVTADGRQAISASWDSTLRVWDLNRGEERRTLRGHAGWVRAVHIAGKGRRAVSAAQDQALKVWDAAGGGCLASLVLDAPPAATALANDGVTVLAGDEGGSVYCLCYREAEG